jgi:predicted alpha/beta superfamily hydrolase
MKTLLCFLTTLSIADHGNQEPSVSSGRLERLADFPSGNIAPRNVDVWLPENYDPSKKYAVVYMNDGQMLFDSTTTWNRQEWCVDEVAGRLMAEDSIRPCIIVGIWNRDKYRYAEYFPEKALSGLSKWRRSRLVRKTMTGSALADAYLRFIVSELKPFIDSTYSTYGDRENTSIMGSSMGGLISLYAACEYPGVFGGAGCLSTHLPMKGVNFLTRNDNRIARAFRKYLKSNLPDPGTHRIYFDYGTKTLDRWYEPYQKKVDALMAAAGYEEGRQWITMKFDGDDHSERSWSARLDIPLTFLLSVRPQ